MTKQNILGKLQDKKGSGEISVFFYICFCLVSCNALQAFQPTNDFIDYNTRYIGIEDGLSHSSVTEIYQDSKGFMWIGTFDGLNRYDGYEFTVYHHQPEDSASLANNRIESIYSHKDLVYIGTKLGLSIYNYKNDRFFTVKFKNDRTGELLPMERPVNDITGNAEIVYVATAGKGLMVRESVGPDDCFYRIPLAGSHNNSLDYHAQAMAFDSRKQLWVFVQGIGITVLNEEAGQLEVVYSGVRSGHSMVFGREHELWMGLDNGVLRYDTDKKMPRFFTEGALGYEVKDLAYIEDRQEIWAATDGNGLFVYTDTSGRFQAFQTLTGRTDIVTSRSVYDLYADDKGRKWIGTKVGIKLILNDKIPFRTISRSAVAGLPGDLVFSFAQQGDRLWIGTDGNGLGAYDLKTGKTEKYSAASRDRDSLVSDFITSLKIRNDNLWIGTYGGGVNRLDNATNTFKRYNLYNSRTNRNESNVWVLFTDSKQRLWAATSDQEGLFVYREEDDRFAYVKSGIAGVLAMTEGKDGRFWIGSYGHLFEFDPETGITRTYNINYPVRSLKFADEHLLMAGTEGGGLLLLDTQRGTRKILTGKDGLPDNSVLNILRDDYGYFWMSTYNGICRFDIKEHKFKNFYAADGLQSNQFNYNAALKLSSGELAFGGIKGSNIINPGLEMPEKDFPNLAITRIKVNNQPLARDGSPALVLDELRVPYEKSMLSFQFVAQEYGNPEKISYACFLEGWDREWQYTGTSRVANYSKLPEGNYTMRIRSTNTDGIWNMNGIAFPVVVNPPWFRTPLAYVLYAVLFGVVISVILLYQKKQSRLKYEVELSGQIAKREKELHEKKINFFTNISHEFRSPLTMIINPLKDIIYGRDQEIDPGTIEVAYRNSRRLLSLVDQLILFRKVDDDTGVLKINNCDIIHLCKEVYNCFIHRAKKKGITYNFHADISNPVVYIDKEKMEIALFNLVSNALKFTKKNRGMVSFEIFENEKGIVMEIADNGISIPPADKKRIFELFYQREENRTVKKKGFGIGLYLVRKIVERHRGTVQCMDNDRGGTTFRIELLGEEIRKTREDGDKATGISMLPDPSFAEDDLQYTAERIPENPTTVDDDIIRDKRAVLIVDDNPQIRAYLSAVLSEYYLVTRASGAEDGLEMLRKQNFDFIISDVVMEKMNGVEFCEIVKNDKDLRHIPVILLTAGTSEELKLMGAEVGADDYITKPFDKEYLKARIKGILNRREVIKKHLIREVTGEQKDLKLSDEDKAFVDRIVEVVELNLNNETFTVAGMAGEVGMSQSLIYKKIKQITGKSITEFIRFIRLRQVATALITTEIQISQAALNAGFGDMKYFRKQFKEQYRMTPSEFRKKYSNVKDKKYILNESFWKME